MDGSGGLTSYEFQAAMRKLVPLLVLPLSSRRALYSLIFQPRVNSFSCDQDVEPPIFVSDSDFLAFTRGGTLCGPDGQLGPAEFETVMREQIRLYVQVRAVQEKAIVALVGRE